MNLTIKPFHKNTYPLKGILIKNKELTAWLRQLQSLNINLNTTPVFAIPDTAANSVWGCLVLMPQELGSEYNALNLQFCQSIQDKLFIPENAAIHPKLNTSEIDSLFAKNPHVFHPEFGLFQLETPIDWQEVLELPEPKAVEITEPTSAAFYPQYIQKIEIKPLPPEELLKEMEQNIFPQKESFEDKPLTFQEKIKYNLLKKLFSLSKKTSGGYKVERNNWLDKIASMAASLFPNADKMLENLEKNLEDYEKRNSSEVEKLMDLFKNNPEEALKYAIPIDNDGTFRGGTEGAFTMNRRWQSFNLFGNNASGGGGGGIVFNDATMNLLQQQYTETAKKFIAEKNYQKAAFVYMKLLKNNHMAAQTLEDGKLYPEAASLYLKYMNNKQKAASCYEKGRMTSEAINLYKELNMNEKVGDLYLTINNKTEAFVHYNNVVDDYKKRDQYVKASLLLKTKMQDNTSAQNMLLTGWREQKDSVNCLGNYFNNIDDTKVLAKEIDEIYKKDTNSKNKTEFLTVIKYVHKQDDTLAEQTKEIAYEIVAELAITKPDILNELPAFNKDHQLKKDITRFKFLNNR
jgi:tetratricopeptide (TPR) repeat protein